MAVGKRFLLFDAMASRRLFMVLECYYTRRRMAVHQISGIPRAGDTSHFARIHAGLHDLLTDIDFRDERE